jgi:hypothetical protein
MRRCHAGLDIARLWALRQIPRTEPRHFVAGNRKDDGRGR